MKTNPLKEGTLIADSVGLGTVTRKMVKKRATELALIDGRTSREVSPSDWMQAKQELTGEPAADPQQEILESAPESERWDPVPGSTGQRVQVAASEDEDLEGRSDNERLVEQGIEEAQSDQARAATRQAL
jgi:hypothetical protein